MSREKLHGSLLSQRRERRLVALLTPHRRMKMDTVTQEKPRIKLRVAYVGECLTTEKEKATRWALLGEGDVVKSYLVYTSKYLRKLKPSIGEIRTLDATDDKGSSIFPESSRYVGTLPHTHTERMTWDSEATTKEVEEELERRRKKETEAESLKASLALAHEQYGRIIGSRRRAAFLAQVIQYVTG